MISLNDLSVKVASLVLFVVVYLIALETFSHNQPFSNNPTVVIQQSKTTNQTPYQLEPKVDVFPNPTTDFVYFSIAEDIHIEQVSVLNNQGIVVDQFTGLPQPLSIAHLQLGNYHLQLTTTDGQQFSYSLSVLY